MNGKIERGDVCRLHGIEVVVVHVEDGWAEVCAYSGDVVRHVEARNAADPWTAGQPGAQVHRVPVDRLEVLR
jgi:hypothetical protein